METDISGKQDRLTAGSNITISGSTISATDTRYTAGEGISISGTTISATSSGGGISYYKASGISGSNLCATVAQHITVDRPVMIWIKTYKSSSPVIKLMVSGYVCSVSSTYIAIEGGGAVYKAASSGLNGSYEEIGIPNIIVADDPQTLIFNRNGYEIVFTDVTDAESIISTTVRTTSTMTHDIIITSF